MTAGELERILESVEGQLEECRKAVEALGVEARGKAAPAGARAPRPAERMGGLAIAARKLARAHEERIVAEGEAMAGLVLGEPFPGGSGPGGPGGEFRALRERLAALAARLAAGREAIEGSWGLVEKLRGLEGDGR